jgi:hypothetical protein
MPAFGLLGIDFGHGFDALPGTSTQTVETTLLLDNNSSFANRFSNTKAMRKQFYFYFWPVTVNLSHSGKRATRMGYIDMGIYKMSNYTEASIQLESKSSMETKT